MKSINTFCLFFILALVTLVSCTREDMDDIVIDDPNYVPDTVIVNNLFTNLKSSNPGGMELGCVTIQFPFELLTESNNTISVDSEQDFLDALELDSPDLVIDFVYPIFITDNDGVNSQIDNVNGLGVIFASCIPELGWNETASGVGILPACLFDNFCFDLIYPVNLEDEAGNSYTAEDEDEFIDVFASYGPLYFTLPVSFEDMQGNEVVVEDIDDFFELAFACEGVSPPVAGEGIEIQGFGCYDLVYPFDVELEDGSIVTINDENEYATLTLNGEVAYLVFPYSLQDLSGNVIVINNIDEFIDALVDCGIFIEIGESDPCEVEAHVLLFYNSLNIFTLNKYPYDINYPVTLVVDGNSTVLNSDDDYLPAVGNNPSTIIPAEIVYPVTVTQFGRDIVLNSDDDVCDFYKTLDEECSKKPAHIQFFFNEGPGTPLSCAYFIEYPIDIEFNGNNIQIDDRQTYLDQLNVPMAYENIELVYPVSVYRLETDAQVIFDSESDICDYLDTCK